MCKINRKLPTSSSDAGPTATPFNFFQQQYAPFFPPPQETTPFFPPQQDPNYLFLLRQKQMQEEQLRMASFQTNQELFRMPAAFPAAPQQQQQQLFKRTTSEETQPPRFKLPRLEGGSDSEDASSASGSTDESAAAKPSEETKPVQPKKRKHEATLDGERRVAIEFENLGVIGAEPQTYGKGKLIVPNGMSGKYSAFGQRWQFLVSHDEKGPVECEDGEKRIRIRWELTNLNSGVRHCVLETPSEALRRDRDGKTVCNRVFRDALQERTKALEEELLTCGEDDASRRAEIEGQLKTLHTKRFSEGPLFFGLRHACLQNEMKKQQQALSNTASI